ncbi:MAG: hypothetical protein ACOCTT_02765 [archaeon]
MSFLIIKVNSESARTHLSNWAKGHSRKELQDKFVRELGNGTYLTEADGDILALVWSLRKRYKGKVDVFVADLLRENKIPENIKGVVKCLEKKPKAKKPLEKVSEVKMRCSINSNEE